MIRLAKYVIGKRTLIILIFILLMMFQFAEQSSADPLTIPVCADTYISSSRSTTFFGSNTYMYVGNQPDSAPLTNGQSWTYLKFDLQSFKDLPYPQTNINVTKVTLNVNYQYNPTVNQSNNKLIGLYSLGSDQNGWIEYDLGALTWLNSSGYQPSNTYLIEEKFSSTGGTNYFKHTFDITNNWSDLYNNINSGKSLMSFVLKTTGAVEDNVVQLASKELDYVNNSKLAPQLVIEYTTSTVPLPPSVYLFGSGLVGLIGLRRFRRA